MRLFNAPKISIPESSTNLQLKEFGQVGAASFPMTAQDILLEDVEQDMEEDQELASFQRQADAVNLFSSGLPMTDQPSQQDDDP